MQVTDNVMIMVYGHEFKMLFQLVDMEEVPIDSPIEENTGCLRGLPGGMAVRDNIHKSSQ